jgi:hypothetical protein
MNYRIKSLFKKQLVFYFILMASFQVQGQEVLTPAVRANNFNWRLQQLGGQLRSGDMISGFSSYDAPDVVGDTYWDKHWGQSSLLMTNRTEAIEGYFTRYDIYKDEFEFNMSNGVKVLQGALVKDMIWLDSLTGATRVLINAREFTEEGTKVAGFLEVLVEGGNSLYKKIRLEILKPDFNPALNVGSKDARILKKESYYFNQGKELVRIKNKKSLDPLIKGKSDSVEAFLKKENIRFSDEKDLIKLFKFLTQV